MKKRFVAILFICSPLLLSAQPVDVSGTISGETWAAGTGPYRVTGDILVESLLIQAGVDVIFTGNFVFRVSGAFSASGTKSDSIRFYSESGIWPGIHFDTTAVTARLSYCSITDASTGMRVNMSTVQLQNTRVDENSGNGIEVLSGLTDLERCTVKRNGAHGLFVTSNGKAQIKNSTFTGNTQNGLKTDTGFLELTNTIVSDNAQGGVFLANSTDSLSFTNCTIVDHSGGPGIVLTAPAVVTGTNSIIYSNAVSVGFSSGTVTIDYSDIQGLSGYTNIGINNIDQDPVFADPQLYTLGTNSPCIDSGDPDSQFNDICFPPGLGTERNDQGAYGGPGACLWLDPFGFIPTSVDFGNVSLADTGEVFIRFQNNRDSLLTISSVEITGPDADHFLIDTDGFNLTAYDSIRRGVQFSPDAAGIYNASIQVSGNFGQAAITLLGTGVVPNIAVDPLNIDFGNVRANNSQSRNIVINNFGIGNLKIISVSSTSTYFSTQTFTLPHIIIPFTSDTIVSVFQPDSAGPFTGSVQITSNDPDESVVAVSMQGIGIAPKIGLGTSQIDIGRVDVMRDTLIHLPISNTGNDTLIVSEIAIIDAQGVFTLTFNPAPFTIAPGNPAQTIDIRYAPETAGVDTAILRIHSNDPKRPVYDLQLSAIAVAPELDIDTENIAFGEIVVGLAIRDSITIRNSGSADLALTWSDIEGGAGAFTLVDPPTTVYLEPGNSQIIRLIFTPADTGSFFAELPLFSNDADADSLRIAITGDGIKPIFNLSSDTLDFGFVLVFSDSSRSLEITNSGSGNLILDTAYLALGENSPFILDSMFPIVIPAYSSSAITVVFRPLVQGNLTDTMYISTNDPQNILYAVALSGQGIAPTLEALTTELIFDSTLVTETTLDSILIRNTGEGDLLLFEAAFKSGAMNSFLIHTNIDSLVLPSGDSLYIVLAFMPEAGGVTRDSLIIQNNDPLNPRLALSVSGTGFYDITPARIQILTSFDSLELNQTFSFEVSVEDDEAIIQEVFLHIRLGDRINYVRLPLSQSGPGIWSVQIPDNLIRITGIQYFLQVFHGGAISNLGTRDEPKNALVQINQFPLPFLTHENRYQMISLPVDIRNQSLSDLFSDDLGEYDNTVFRFFDWDQSDSIFIELTEMDSHLKPGDALWLITRESQQLDISNSVSAPIDSMKFVALKTGWNMIANPYAYDVFWSSVTDTFIQANSAFYFDGIEWTFPVDVLEPFRGYAVYSNSADTLRVPSIQTQQNKISESPPEWEIRISAFMGEWQDTYNYVGARMGSSERTDTHDVHEPPGPAEFISLYLGKNLAADYRQPGKDGYRFDITLAGKETIDLRIEPKNFPDHLGWELVSPATKIIFKNENISLDQGSYHLVLFVGSNDFLSREVSAYDPLPEQYEISQNFPNPFNPITTVRYQLPYTSQISILIYNVLGQRVKTLKKDALEQVGYHTVQWDGRDDSDQMVSSGIYFLQLRSRKFIKTIKMILQQ